MRRRAVYAGVFALICGGLCGFAGAADEGAAVFDEVVAAGVSRAAVHVEVRRRSAKARIGDSLSQVIVRTLSGAANVAATTTRLPSRLALQTGQYCSASWS